jgi:hypothetical protein
LAHDPLITNNLIDSCAFDPKPEVEATASNEIFALAEAGHFQLAIPYSTLREIDHPNTPAAVKRMAANHQYTISVALTPDETRILSAILRILAGNGKPESMQRDSENVFEAQKYGGHFITNDGRVLARADQIYALCGLSIVKPTEFLVTVRKAMGDEGGPRKAGRG